MKLFTVKTGRKGGFIRSCCYKAKKNIMEGLSVIFGKGCFFQGKILGLLSCKKDS